MDTSKWDDLRFVLAVAEAGSVNAAASELNVNHATILRRVAAFEAFHNTKVFVRHAKGYAVAPDATAIIEAIRDVEKSVDAMERVISGRNAGLDGTIRVTSTDSMCQTVLPPLIRRFHESHPRLTIELHASNAHLNMSKLDAELTIRPARALPDDLIGEEATQLAFRVYGAPSYLAKTSSPKPQAHRWLGITELLKGSPVGQWESAMAKRNIVFRADSFVTLADMAETGFGLTMIPTILGEPRAGLQRMDDSFGALDTRIWVACHRDLRRAPKIATCMDYFAKALRASPAFDL